MIASIQECVLIIASLCAIVSCFFSVPSVSYIDFKVLILLLNLMLIVAAFKELKILDFLAISIILLSLFLSKEKNEKLELTIEPITLGQPIQIGIFICLFLVVLLSVFHILPYILVAMIVWITVLVCHKHLFMKVDYSLLVTFIAFFIFIGNLSHMKVVKNFMESVFHTGQNTFWASLLSSQVISTVPATILIANFTPHYKELLLGVNLGGMGMIASLASVISYKLYAKEYPTKAYLKTFSLYNLLGLVVLVPIIYWLFIR